MPVSLHMFIQFLVHVSQKGFHGRVQASTNKNSYPHKSKKAKLFPVLQ